MDKLSDKDEIKSSYFSGITTGAINSTIFYPIDICRVRLFLKRSGNIGHVRSFSNGLLFNVFTGAIKNSATYPTHDMFKRILKNKGFSEVYSGLCTGITLSLIGNPINAIKVPMQTSIKKTTALQVTRNIYNNYGLKGFYRGGFGLFLRDVTWAGVYFPCYSFIHHHLNNSFRFKQKFNKQNEIISSLIAGVASMSVAYPFDGMRLYRQHHTKDFNIWHGLRESFKLTPKNIKSFSTGLVRVPLSTTFSHIFYLYVKEFLEKMN